MSEQDVDFEAIAGSMPLEGEDEPDEAPRPAATPAAGDEKAKDGPTDAEKAKTAEAIDAKIRAILRKSLPNPEPSLLMVDILMPGQAIITFLPDLKLSPRQHFFLAMGGLLFVALATNPEVLQKLRSGFTRKDKAPKKDAAKQKQLPAGDNAQRPAAPAKKEA